MRIKVNVQSSLNYTFLVLILYLSGSVMSSIQAKSVIYTLITTIALIIAAIFFVKDIKKGHVQKRLLVAIFTIMLAIVIEFLVSPSTVLLFFTRMVWLVVFLFYSHYAWSTNIDIEDCLYRIILSIASISLIFFVLIDVLHFCVPSSPVPTSLYSHYDNYFYVFYEYAPMYTTSIGGFTFNRLQSFFWEPGVYQIFLNFALYRLLFFDHREKKKKITTFIVLSVSIVFTMSTTGIILYFLLIAIRFYYSNYFSKKSKALLLIPVVLVISFVAASVISEKRSTYTGGVSYGLRVGDIVNGWKVFLKHPVVGTGFDNNMEFMAVSGMERGCSNGLISLLYSTGVVGTVAFSGPFLVNYIRKKHGASRSSGLAYLVWFFVSNATEPLLTLPIIWLLYSKEVINFLFKK